MIKFLKDFRFKVVEDPGDQLIPLFEQGRAARVSRGNIEFQMEESKSIGAKACFNLFLTDYSDEEIENIKILGHKCDMQESIYGEFHFFRSPDGGVLVL